MRIPLSRLSPLVCTLLLGLACVPPLAAQSFEAVGTRAQGMGGAFVAVANDATATWWNPAGLAAGPYLNASVEYGQIREPADPLPAGPAARNSTLGIAVAFPALGLSYYRLRLSEVAPADSIGAVEPGRQDQGTAGSVLHSIALTEFGVTVGQSIGQHLVVASTLRLLRGGAVVTSAVGDSDPLDQADDLSVPRVTETDLDLGVMLRLGFLAIGGVLKHVSEPDFGDEPARLVLERQGRLGVAATKGKTGMLDSLTGAVDVDLTTTEGRTGEIRRLALGGEATLLRSRVAIRGGLNTSVIGDADWSPSAGASVGIRWGLFVDGAIIVGSGESPDGWSVSLRSTF